MKMVRTTSTLPAMALEVTSLLVFLTLPVAQCYKLIDLSHTQNTDTLYWPSVPSFKRTVPFQGSNEENVWIESGAYSSGEHGGTHIDVPRHFYKTGMDLEQYPLERTIADGVMIDCRVEAENNKNYSVSVEKIQQWEAENGRIPNEAGVLFYFGYAQKFHDPAAYFNTEEYTNFKKFVFPYVSAEAGLWLAENRDISMIGMDVASPDRPQDMKYPIHVTLLSRMVLILENVNIPSSLPPRDFRLYATPIKITNGTGVQTRIFATLYDHIGSGVNVSRQTISLMVSSLAVTLLFKMR